MSSTPGFVSNILVVAVSASTLLVTQLSNAMPNYRFINKQTLDAVEKRYGYPARKRVANWSRMLDQTASSERKSDNHSLNLANDYFNQIEWKWDSEHWGVEDFWATPIETLATNAGDCEDFSIGKYFSLTSVGMDVQKLRITYVKALDYNLAHMVLAYYPSPNADPLILDNINKTILPASQRTDLLPIYGFNGEGIWLAKSTKRLGTNPAKNIPSWGKMYKRMKYEIR